MTATDGAPCEQCGHAHAPTTGGRPCIRHRSRDGLACTRRAMEGQNVCASHGGKSPQALAAAQRALDLANAEKQVRKLIPDNPDPIRDPVAVLAMLAGEADAVRRVVAAKVNELTEIRTLGKDGAEQLHAYVTLYERSFDRTARTCEALVKSNYLERYGAIQEAQLSLLLSVVQHAVRLIPDADTRQAVTDDIIAGLRTVGAPTAIAS